MSVKRYGSLYAAVIIADHRNPAWHRLPADELLIIGWKPMPPTDFSVASYNHNRSSG
jgi:hypothetical protein